MPENTFRTPAEEAWKAALDERSRTRLWLETQADGKPAEDKKRLLVAARLLSEPTLSEWHLSEDAMHEGMQRSIEKLTTDDLEASLADHRDTESDLLKEYRQLVAEEQARINASGQAHPEGLSPESMLSQAVWRSAQWLHFVLRHGTTPRDTPFYRPLDALQDVGFDTLEVALVAVVDQESAADEVEGRNELLRVAFGLTLAWRCIAETGVPLAWRHLYSAMAQEALLQTQS